MNELCARLAANDAEKREVTFFEENFQKNELKAICDALANNTVVDRVWLVRMNIVDCGPIANLLRTNSSVTSISLSGNPLVSAPFFQALSWNDSLRRLYLSNTKLSDGEVELLVVALSKNNTLKSIHLGENRITDRGVILLASVLYKNESVEELMLNGNMCTDVGALALADMLMVNRTLLHLNVARNLISDFGRAFLLDALEHNHTLLDLFCSFSNDMTKQSNALAKRNVNATRTRKSQCQMVLVCLLGMRKRRRFQSGLWVDQPREIILMIAKLIWYKRGQSDWQPLNNVNKKVKY
jgi:hypothetical protein